MDRNAESLGASTNALRLSMVEKDTLLLLRKKTLDMVKPRLAEISSRRGEGPDSLKGQMGVIDDAVRLHVVRDIDRWVLQLDAVIAEDRPNVIANEGVRMERQLERLTASAERLRKAARRLMRNSGDGVYKIRLADRDAPQPPPWIRRTRPGREVVTYMTNQRAVAMQAQLGGYSVLGLDADDDLSSSAGSGRSRDQTWRASMSRASLSHGSSTTVTTGETLGTRSDAISAQSMASSFGGAGGPVQEHECLWGL